MKTFLSKAIFLRYRRRIPLVPQVRFSTSFLFVISKIIETDDRTKFYMFSLRQVEQNGLVLMLHKLCVCTYLPIVLSRQSDTSRMTHHIAYLCIIPFVTLNPCFLCMFLQIFPIQDLCVIDASLEKQKNPP